MLQANLAIILTFITTLIDELAETDNLSNAKLIVIAIAFITVIIIFNYTLKEDSMEMNSINALASGLQNNMNMLAQMPKQFQLRLARVMAMW